MNVVIYKRAKEENQLFSKYLIFMDTKGIYCKCLHCGKLLNKKLSRKYLNKFGKDVIYKNDVYYHHNLPVYNYWGYDYLRIKSYVI